MIVIIKIKQKNDWNSVIRISIRETNRMSFLNVNEAKHFTLSRSDVIDLMTQDPPKNFCDAYKVNEYRIQNLNQHVATIKTLSCINSVIKGEQNTLYKATNSLIVGDWLRVGGNGNLVVGNGCYMEGDENMAVGNGAYVQGNYCVAYGDICAIEGETCLLRGKESYYCGANGTSASRIMRKDDLHPRYSDLMNLSDQDGVSQLRLKVLIEYNRVRAKIPSTPTKYLNGATYQGHGEHIVGDDNIVGGDSMLVFGNRNKVKGNFAFVQGDQCTVKGYNCFILGDYAVLDGSFCGINGREWIVRGKNNIFYNPDAKRDPSRPVVSVINLVEEPKLGESKTIHRPPRGPYYKSIAIPSVVTDLKKQATDLNKLTDDLEKRSTENEARVKRMIQKKKKRKLIREPTELDNERIEQLAMMRKFKLDNGRTGTLINIEDIETRGARNYKEYNEAVDKVFNTMNVGNTDVFPSNYRNELTTEYNRLRAAAESTASVVPNRLIPPWPPLKNQKTIVVEEEGVRYPDPYPEESSAPEGEGTCVVCYENYAICLMLPCRHLNMCVTCTLKSKPKACFTCRTSLTEIMRIYSCGK